jgi:hypothetical protein
VKQKHRPIAFLFLALFTLVLWALFLTFLITPHWIGISEARSTFFAVAFVLNMQLCVFSASRHEFAGAGGDLCALVLSNTPGP